MGGVCMKRRKIIALLLSFMLLFSLLPNGAAWAEDQDGVETSSPSDADEGEVNETGVGELDVQEPQIQLRQLMSPLAAPVLRGAPSGNDSGGEQQSGESGLTENNEISQTRGSGSPDTSNMVFVQFDNLSSISEADKKLTFKVGDKSYDVTVNYVSELAGDVIWVTEGENKGIYINADDSVLANVKFVVPQTFRDDRNGIRIIVGNRNVELSISGGNECNLAGLRLAAGNVIHFEPYSSGGGGDNPGPSGNTNAVINLIGVEGDWTGPAATREDYFIDNGDGTWTVEYNKSKYEVGIGLVTENGDGRCKFTDSTRDPAEGVASQKISYNKDDQNPDTLYMVVKTSWSNVIEEIIVNGERCVIPIDYSDRYSSLQSYGDQSSVMWLPIRPVEATNQAEAGAEPDMAEVYNVEVKVRPVTDDECYVGNFLWSNDDAFAPDGNNSNDLYIGHSKLVLQSAVFNDGDGSGDKSWTLDVNDNGQSAEYNYTDASGNVLPYVHLGLNRENFDTHVKVSEMLIPAGSKVTMTITPEPGYQVVDFTGVDFDDGSVQLPGGQCVYTFTVGKGNFHLGAKVEEVEDDVDCSETDEVEGAMVELADGTLDAGTARLTIEDADLSEEKEAEFTDVADTEGLEIESVLDISLAQIFYQGKGNKDDVWSNEIEDLDEAATIGLDLDEDFTGEEVYVIHNIHDGEEFEVTEAEVVDAAKGQIMIPAESFSSYAIATKPIQTVTPEDDSSTPSKEATVTPAAEKKTEVKSTKPATSDNFNIMLIGAIAIVSAAGIVFVVRRKRMLGK